jgi:CRP-like cAMP-binding protein
VPPRADHSHALTRKISSVLELTLDERAAIARLPVTMRTVKSNADIAREGDRPSQSCLLVRGYLCRAKVLDKGKRQIISFHIAGDIPDLQSLHLRTLDHDLTALTEAIVAFIPHQALLDLGARFPRIADYFWRETLVDASIFRDWIVNVGRRDAYMRIAHLLCEQATRHKAVGLADDSGFPLFLTQAAIGDATGLSGVHVNRVFQQLRAAGLVSTGAGRLNILDWAGLAAAGEFDAAYLHLAQ